MVCIYCGSETEVTNSRLRARNPSVWRRRACKVCVAQFTTLELPDYATALVVQTREKKKFSPFNRDKLFLSIYQSLGHRPDALSSATALTETVIGRLLTKKQAKEGVVHLLDLVVFTYEALKRFDKAAAASYKAYHQAALSRK